MKALAAVNDFVVKFANVSLEGGDMELAKKKYVDALILFKKLGNDRGVSACLVRYRNSAKQRYLYSPFTYVSSRVRSQARSCAHIVLHVNATTFYEFLCIRVLCSF